MLLLDPYIRDFVSPFGHSHHRTFIDPRPNAHSHLWLAMPLSLFLTLTSNRASAFSRLYRASDFIRFQKKPVGASGKAFWGVAPSFHLSKYQLLLFMTHDSPSFLALYGYISVLLSLTEQCLYENVSHLPRSHLRLFLPLWCSGSNK